MTENTPPEKDEDDYTLDPVAQFILDYMQAHGEKSVNPENIAKAFYEPRRREKDRGDAWRKYFQAVKQQAFFLHRQGAIAIERRGERVEEVRDLKGKWKIARL